ncbi:MAG TPA: hypothetical protein VK519_03900 [Pinirhizobacter sp.]|uniref:hypothetical protein n=1 Tax=Pinirhizobacter sp. TaxID=2950432 RepID=UPI002CD5B87A|nr:hypothetical protein [Pinirhizobacter sp.]HMH67044.1 hypothetical protein [Pinirhizobacter sp.]
MGLVSLRKLTVFCALALAGTPLQPTAAQSAPAPAPAAATPAARPADVASEDAVIKAVYDVISGPKGQQRDWDRMRSLFVPGARLISAHTGEDGVVTAHVMSVEDYIRLGEPMLKKDGFFEREAHRTEDRFGNIVQVFSTYESRHEADAKPFQRGINSFQLLFDGKRWWVVTIYWQGEKSPERPIPKQYGG